MPENGLPLCSGSVSIGSDGNNGIGSVTGAASTSTGGACRWSDNAVASESRIYIGQPHLNRIVVFHAQQLSIVQVIATDPQPRQLWLVRGLTEDRIWILCHGESDEWMHRESGGLSGPGSTSSAEAMQYDQQPIEQSSGGASMMSHLRTGDRHEYEWNSPSLEQKRHNRRTVQVIRLSANSRIENVIHLQPIDGHFDLVYDLFVPISSPIYNHLPRSEVTK